MNNSTRSRRLSTIAVTVLMSVGLIAPATLSAPSAQAATPTISAKTLLGQISVKAEVKSGYARSKFKHWVDADKDKCNTRNEVLIAEATKKPKVAKKNCALSGGKWASKYDGKSTASPSSFDIDHMVPLKESWDSGANTWTAATREKFANDLGYGPSLIAVSASSNRSKGDKDPAQWAPPRAAYRCTYAKEWVAVKWRWKLSIDSAEKAALTKALNACGKNINVAKPARASVAVVKTTTTTTKTTTTSKTSGQLPLKARCKDGTYSYKKDVTATTYTGLCAGHGGVKDKLGRVK